MPLLPDEPCSLSELDIASADYFFFPIGHLLATMHSQGMLHRRAEPGNLYYQPGTGMVRSLKWNKLDIELAPGNMLPDLEIMAKNFKPGGLRAILSGYMQSAWAQIEPIRPGYVEEMIRLVGGTVTCLPRPAVLEEDWTRLVAALDLPNMGGTTAPSEQLATLFIAARMCNLPLRNASGALIAGELPEISAALEGREARPGLTASIRAVAKLSSPLTGGETDALFDMDAAARTLRVLQSAEFASDYDLLTRIGDALDAIAFRYDQPDADDVQRQYSMKAAQYSEFIVRALHLPDSRDEEKILTLVARHGRLSWFPALLEPKQDARRLIHELAYVETRAALLLEAFLRSAADKTASNPLRSCLWRCLMLMRQSLVSISRTTWPENLAETFRQLVMRALTRLAHAIGYVVKADAGYLAAESSAPHPKWLLDEANWAIEAQKLISSSKADDPEARAVLNRLTQLPYFQQGNLFYVIHRYWR